MTNEEKIKQAIDLNVQLYWEVNYEYENLLNKLDADLHYLFEELAIEHIVQLCLTGK